ncbi:NAD(P)H-dependent flavin oxidoreductase [Bacillus sp. 2205SS5-2]|uniref:NAD(P)H-dependent flavin oxidoreductase n=1 Tax=Bacillus sp. 2205SS5-2 TaxID=3109031 RepID=UPI00300656F3
MNRVVELLGISYPIIQGGMGNISSSFLAAAISNAGGLGTVGTGTMNPSEVEELLTDLQDLTKRKYAVNIAINVTPHLKELVALVLKYNVPIVSLSAGNPAPLIPVLKQSGVTVICVVASTRQALKAEKAGADLLVAEGYEAAGINSNLETTTLTLIPQIADAVSIPVIAAGGIGDGRGLAAAFSLGASGIQMGTRFIATKEAPYHENYKNKILVAQDDETMIVGRSIGRVRRIIKTNYGEKLLQAEATGVTLEKFNEKTSEEYHKIGAIEGKLDEGFINGGQVSGLIKDVQSVSDLLEEMVETAKIELKKAYDIL